MAKKTKEPAKAGDVTTIVGGVKALINHIQARDWWSALTDFQAIMKELGAGFAVPAMAKLQAEGCDPCSDDSIACLCDCLEEKCKEVENCEDASQPAKAVPAMAGGMWLQILMPVLSQALQAILNGLLKQKAEMEGAK